MFSKRQILGLILSLLFLSMAFSPQALSYYYLQEEQRLPVGEQMEFLLKFPPAVLQSINVYIREGEKLLALQGQEMEENAYRLGRELSPVLMEPGQVKLELKLFDLIPIKQISVDIQPNLNLIPGGHSIGVLLRTEGVMVVGFSPILDDMNEPCFPARDAGIELGDIIIEVNGQKVATDDQVKEIVGAWQPEDADIVFKIRRKDALIEKTLRPQFCLDTRTYRIGLFIRDNAGGVGTLTFYDPASAKYGALGHVITDSENNQALRIKQGKIMPATVESIQKAKRGFPGEKVGLFIENNDMGDITINASCGIYGTAQQEITNPLYPRGLPIAYSNQIRTGPAEILTVVKGEKINKYSVEIEKILNNRQDNKNMIIRINDQSLFAATGGIIQGMSGSPIIQNGRIVGAVTHVFVNDPQRGYAVFIENMLFEAGILPKEKTLGSLHTQGLSLWAA